MSFLFGWLIPRLSWSLDSVQSFWGHWGVRSHFKEKANLLDYSLHVVACQQKCHVIVQEEWTYIDGWMVRRLNDWNNEKVKTGHAPSVWIASLRPNNLTTEFDYLGRPSMNLLWTCTTFDDRVGVGWPRYIQRPVVTTTTGSGATDNGRRCAQVFVTWKTMAADFFWREFTIGNKSFSRLFLSSLFLLPMLLLLLLLSILQKMPKYAICYTVRHSFPPGFFWPVNV